MTSSKGRITMWQIQCERYLFRDIILDCLSITLIAVRVVINVPHSVHLVLVISETPGELAGAQSRTAVVIILHGMNVLTELLSTVQLNIPQKYTGMLIITRANKRSWFNPLNPHDASKHHFISFLTPIGALERKFS